MDSTIVSPVSLHENSSDFRIKHAQFEKYLNALLADLHNTISPPEQKKYHPQAVNGANNSMLQQLPNNSSTYGSLKKPGAVNFDESQIEPYRSTNSPSNYPQQPQRNSPTYQNAASIVPKTSLNDLDSLLDDLNSGTGQSSKQKPAENFVTDIDHHVNNILNNISNSVNGNGCKNLMFMKKETKTEKSIHGFPSEFSHTCESFASSDAKALENVASSATKELDALMETLSDIKVNENHNWHNHQEISDSVISYAQPKPKNAIQSKNTSADFEDENQLDSMLGNLKADMSRQGINTSQKGCCNACNKPIVGQVITALGKTWHPEHFTCTHCTQELGTRNFFERDGRPYCETDYHNLFSPRCAYCNGPILDKCVTALEKTWHMEHFFCAQCGKQFGEEGFHEKDGKPYCRDDYFDLFAPKCGACNRAITENYISALNTQWHSNCFVCRDCKKPVQGKSFYAVEGKPVCPKCIGAEDK